MAEQLLLDGGFTRAALGVKNGEQERQSEKNDTQPDGELLQDVRRLRSENIFRHAPAEGRAESLVFRALHQHHHDHEQADQHVEGDEDGNEDRHEPDSMAGRASLVKKPVRDSALIFALENP